MCCMCVVVVCVSDNVTDDSSGDVDEEEDDDDTTSSEPLAPPGMFVTHVLSRCMCFRSLIALIAVEIHTHKKHHHKKRSILKPPPSGWLFIAVVDALRSHFTAGGTESGADVTSDSASNDRKVSFGRQKTVNV